MSIDSIRRCCLAMPHVSESVLWGDNLVFKIGGKMFAVLALEPAETCLSFQCSSDDFADLTERPKIIPAPYLARHSWVALEMENALSRSEIEQFLEKSYALAQAKLPRKSVVTLSRTRKE